MNKFITNTFFLIACLFTATACHASQTVTDDLAATTPVTRAVKIRNSFNKIEVGSCYKLFISRGPAKVEITASPEMISDTKFENNNGTLRISRLNNRNWSGRSSQEAIINITTPQLSGIDASGASSVTVNSTFDSAKFEIEGCGAAHLTFGTISCTEFELDLSGAASALVKTINCSECEIDLSGGSSMQTDNITCTELSADTSGAGDFTASRAKCNTAELDASGGSKIKVSGIDAVKVECEASGAGNITVSGKCNNAELKATGTACINAKNLKANSISKSRSAAATINQ